MGGDPYAGQARPGLAGRGKLPAGWFIAAHYWDIESGGLDLRDRGHGTAHEQINVGIPRDGRLAALLSEIASGAPTFAAVVCEDIERSGRETYNALKLEKRLRDAGIPLFAADEPINVEGANATTVLVWRIKQGVAEWYRLQIKEKAWAGLREHTLDGWNIGAPPYGYLAEKVPHSVPAKRAEDRTKTRLALAPRQPPRGVDLDPAAAHPAIISRETYDTAQQVTAARASMSAVPGQPAHPLAQRTYELRGRIRCRLCKRRMAGITRTAGTYYVPPTT